MFVRSFEDGVFGIPTGKEGHGTVRKRGNEEGGESNRHFLGEAAHAKHVLFVMTSMDDRAGTQEECRFKAGVRRHVE